LKTATVDLERRSLNLILKEMKWLPVLLVAVLASTVPVQAQKGKDFKGTATIKKCQDANGTWHYGDFAAEECERAKVTEINQRGITVKERERLPTKEELEAKQAERQQKKAEAKRQAEVRKEEQRLLNTYESADAIVKARDDRVIAIDREITANNKLKEKSVKEAKKLADTKDPKQKKRLAAVQNQVDLFDKANAALLEDRKEVIEHYNELYIQYQTLVQRQSSAK